MSEQLPEDRACASSEFVHIAVDGVRLEGMLELPPGARVVVVFAHGSGSSRLSPRNNFVAREMRAAGLGTLLIDLLTPQEDRQYETRFDIDLLTDRLARVARWVSEHATTKTLKTGLFGASTGAASALRVAADMRDEITAVVSRGGRPDLTGTAELSRVRAPVLLIVGGADTEVVALNHAAYRELRCRKEFAVVPGATHLFEEPGALEHVARLASRWFMDHVASDFGVRPSGQDQVPRNC